MYSAVFCKGKAVSYNVSDTGAFDIVGVGHVFYDNGIYSQKSDERLALDIIVQQKLPKIRTVKQSDLLPTITTTIMKYKRAVQLIEQAVLSPYTLIGRKRLERDFATLVEDVVIEI